MTFLQLPYLFLVTSTTISKLNSYSITHLLTVNNSSRNFINNRLNSSTSTSSNTNDHQQDQLERPTIQFDPIGYFESCFPRKNGTPRQGRLTPTSQGKLKIDCRHANHMLKGLDQYSHVWVLFWFHNNYRIDKNTDVITPPDEDRINKQKQKQLENKIAKDQLLNNNNQQEQQIDQEQEQEENDIEEDEENEDGEDDGEESQQTKEDNIVSSSTEETAKERRKRLRRERREREPRERKVPNPYVFTKEFRNPPQHVVIRPPRLNGKKVGIYASRSPHRLIPIGLTMCKLERIDYDTVYLSGVDLIDQTPVIDIKPYIPKYDSVPEAITPDWIDSPSDIKSVIFTEDSLQGLKQSIQRIGLKTLNNINNNNDNNSDNINTSNQDIVAMNEKKLQDEVTRVKTVIREILINEPRSVYRRKKKTHERWGFFVDNLNIESRVDPDGSAHVLAIIDSDTYFKNRKQSQGQ
ncbi:hypothetical protein DFA_00735 [Cavenderia fasciculata]|uniref:TsaA-like domain-containing protein n=1 Tax=Cavenderia fasciculata TaxID=261658 RepID=F4PTI8_CACFS|nr:uncharacterized protein DFA_00735 [Cavenderia fasciculata]EGG20870.1 hypothetical protein DFA_00735 [Cavenderia fasciculata]|eukprot:XP_004358720.1 hypothetical protein DFA_00735 [Cavenderia fasciculata]